MSLDEMLARTSANLLGYTVGAAVRATEGLCLEAVDREGAKVLLMVASESEEAELPRRAESLLGASGPNGPKRVDALMVVTGKYCSNFRLLRGVAER